jgi:nickel/cobalt transporter (NiCoT) family protein
MYAKLYRVLKNGEADLRRRFLLLFGSLIAANFLVWLWALVLLQGQPVLLGTAVLAYSFGLRHAVDADHIAAIDNVTRKLMQQGQRPVAVGFFFSLGHSAIIVAMSIIVAIATSAVQTGFESIRAVGGLISTLTSATFLFLIAFVNVTVLASVYRTFRAVRRGEPFIEEDFDILLNRRGLLNRIFRPVFGVVTRGWHLMFIGLLFGLGFDTVTEIGLFGISATQAQLGLSFASVMVFPALFAAGMSLVDTLDGMMMLGAYGWAFMKPVRKLFYNMTITAVSVIVALVIGLIETLGLLTDQLDLKGPLWDSVRTLNDNWGTLGYIIIAIFAASWVASVIIYRVMGYDHIEIKAAEASKVV